MRMRPLSLRLAGVALALVALGVLARFLPLEAWLEQGEQALWAMGGWAFLLYPLAFALCNLLLLPGTILAIGSGVFFGLWWGTLLTLAGNMVGAAIAFFVSHRLARRWLEARVLGNPRWQALHAAIGREGWKVILLTQALPLFPSSLLNYLYPLASIRFRPCMAWIALGQLPALFFYNLLGVMTRLGLRERENPWQTWAWLAGLGVTIGGFLLLTRIAARLLAAARNPALPTQPFDTGAFGASVKNHPHA